ncbi:MAG TPA: Trk system potassium transporter TrkA [Polyangiaceae bacterium LLY-WYZ-14_1]|jgi:trk system potassium uptake protein TrkA|nr:Trk system potassium transporter TrkA [Polyangiaceae bacterium LLY-WYZ-14_1]
MYVVVIGLGEVGRHLVQVLDKEGHDVVAVDADSGAVAQTEEHHDVMTLVGYGASHDVLAKAGVGKADLVVGVTDHDEVNLIAALAAKQLGAKRVVARAQGNEWARWTEGVRYGLLGVDVVINPRVLLGQELAKVARSHGATEVIDLARSQLELVQVELDGESRHTGKPLAKMDLPRGTLVAAVVREGRLFVPGGADVLVEGDRIYLIGRPGDILKAEDMFTKSREARRVCIVGGGVIGEALARGLVEDDAEVMVIERDRERAEALGASLDRVTVVHGDGTDLRLLKEMEVDTYDLFASVTPEDGTNLMAALLAQQVSVPRTAAVVHQGDSVSIYKQLGIDIAVSPRSVASDHILRYARTTSLQSLTVLEGGQAEVLELSAARTCRAAGVPLRHMNLPHGSLMAAIVSDEQVIIPRGDDEVKGGDTVILLTTKDARPTIEHLFQPRGR